MDLSDTTKRILEAAIEVFLEKGYDAATIRDICAKAEANVAAVNYHFGSKDALHAAVLEHIMLACHERYPMHEGMERCKEPEERLLRFVVNLLRMDFPEDPKLARESKLFWMEMGNPSPALKPLVERFMRPIRDMLEAILRENLGPGADDETVRLCAGSVVGQCFFHAQNRVIISELYPDKTYHPHDVDQLARHIFLFSLAGIEAVRQSIRRQA
ncbi:MAG: CerR family C-terminal domain-containing protein [Desulfovibrio sp.]|nr:CerR family C-terminal domain-containing protein [Desulfovibrio sp.]MBI4957915.1 CerR family C-terminal domain-containing protein [Desulfovibrio sp.]